MPKGAFYVRPSRKDKNIFSLMVSEGNGTIKKFLIEFQDNIKHRAQQTKGRGSRTATLAIVHKLSMEA